VSVFIGFASPISVVYASTFFVDSVPPSPAVAVLLLPSQLQQRMTSNAWRRVDADHGQKLKRMSMRMMKWRMKWMMWQEVV